MFLYDSDHDHSESTTSNPINHLHKQFKEDRIQFPLHFSTNQTNKYSLSNSDLNDSFKYDDDHEGNSQQNSIQSQVHTRNQSMKQFPSNLKENLPNKIFPYHYNMNFYTHYDFIFEFPNTSSQKILIKKTYKLQSYPIHLKATLFASEKERLIRQREYPLIEISFNELKELGHRQYRKGKFREALKLYLEGYGLLKWIELKDKASYAKIIQNHTPILDDDVIEQSCLGDDCSSYSYNDNIVIILLSLSYTFIELSHYKNAIECLNECLSYDEMNTTALYRRSQARMYNKNSNENEIQLAMNDINKAMMIYTESNSVIPLIYKEHFNLLNSYIIRRKKAEEELIRNFIQQAKIDFSKYEDRLFKFDTSIAHNTTKVRKQDTQWKVLKMMKNKYKMIIKYYNETKNEVQLALASKEIDGFMENYKQFKFFYLLDVSKALMLNYENKIDGVEGECFKNFLEFYKERTVDVIFQAGNFNNELIKYAILKVDREIKQKSYLETDWKKNDLTQQNYFDEKNIIEGWHFPKKNKLPKSLSLPLSLLLLCVSIAIIFTHYFLVFLNPHRIFYIKE